MTAPFPLAVDAVLRLDEQERKLIAQLIQSLTTGTNDVPIRWVPEGTEVT